MTRCYYFGPDTSATAIWVHPGLYSLMLMLATLAVIQAAPCCAQNAHDNAPPSEVPLENWARLLNAPIQLRMDRAKPIAQFTQILSFMAPVQVGIRVAQDLDKTTSLTIHNHPIHDVLDRVALETGLHWRIQDNAIVLYRDLRAHIFHLPADDVPKVAFLLREREIQKKLWGDQAKAPSGDVFIALDEPSGSLLIQESAAKIEILGQWLRELRDKSLESIREKYEREHGLLTCRLEIFRDKFKSLEELQKQTCWPEKTVRSFHWDSATTLTLTGEKDFILDLVDQFYLTGSGRVITGRPTGVLKIQLATPEALARDRDAACREAVNRRDHLLRLLYFHGGHLQAHLDGRGYTLDFVSKSGIVMTIYDDPMLLKTIETLLGNHEHYKVLSETGH